MRPATQQDRGTRSLATFWTGLALAIAYFAAGKLALLLAIPPGYATAVWPAAGIALVGILLHGPRVWPGIWLGSFLTNVDVSLGSHHLDHSLSVAATIAVGASLQALLGAALIRRFVGFPTSLTGEREVVRFLLLGGPLASLVCASVGVVTLTLAGLNPIEAAAFSWFTWWVGDTIGVSIAAPLLLMWRGEPAEVWRPRRLSVGVPLVVTFAVTVGIFVFASHWERERARDEFERQAENLSRRVEENLGSYLEILRSVASLYAGSSLVERDEFRVFVRSLIIYHPGIQAVSWNPRVSDGEREAFERSVRREGFPDFRIREQDERREMVPAGRRREYVPVTYVEPYLGNESSLGYDSASSPERRRVQEAARDSGKFGVTGRLRLVQDDGHEDRAGVLVFVPVYRNGLPHETFEQRRANHLGYITGVLRIDDVMATALSAAELEGIHLRLVDEAAGDPKALLWGVVPGSAEGFRFRHPLNVNGIDWALYAVRDDGYLIAHRSLNAWMVLLCGLLLDSLLGSFLLMLTGRTARIEALVAERTTELSHAKDSAEQELRDRIEAEQALRASESQFRSVTESANDAIVLADAHGRILRWNRAAERCFGYAERDVIGQSLTLLMPKRYRAAHRQGLARLALGGEARVIGRVVELHGLRKDGAEFPAEISLSSWSAADGAFYSGVIRDVTDRHRAAAELQQALQEAEAASQAKGEFLANMSHEIRTPMNAVIAMTGLLNDTPLDDQQRDFVETIRSSGDYLLSVINDILDFSKVEAGCLELERSCFDLRRCVEEIVELMAPEARAKGLVLGCRIADGVPHEICTDAGRLRQVLVNLIGNALKFTHQGDVAIEVEASPVAPRKAWELHFRVRDTGIGIPASRVGQLFEAFMQADSSITRRFGGTGLGLAISRRLCDLLGGRIWVESEEGRGSTFHFTIVADAPTRQEAEGIASSPPDAAALERPAPLPPLADLRALVVEDSSVNQKVARLLLRKLGIADVDAVGNGLEAIEALERRRYDLVLMDVQMPEMDGIAATRAICARWPREQRPAIVATTAHALAEDRERCLAAGMDGYVAKPIRAAALAAELQRILGER